MEPARRQKEREGRFCFRCPCLSTQCCAEGQGKEKTGEGKGEGLQLTHYLEVFVVEFSETLEDSGDVSVAGVGLVEALEPLPPTCGALHRAWEGGAHHSHMTPIHTHSHMTPIHTHSPTPSPRAWLLSLMP